MARSEYSLGRAPRLIDYFLVAGLKTHGDATSNPSALLHPQIVQKYPRDSLPDTPIPENLPSVSVCPGRENALQ